MRRGIPAGRRHFGTIDDPIAIDSHEVAAREAASARMLELLAEQHPERATVSHPHGTRSPRRVPMPVTGGTVQAIDYEG